MNLYSDGFGGPTTDTTTYLGSHLEMEQVHSSLGSTSPAYTWYYYAGQKRIALRQGTSAPVWLLTDHLGSTSLTIDASGARTSELRYKPWGETRYTWGSVPTDHRFTGQTFDSQIGLYYYGARYYDPVIGRFAQADILVPEPGNPQSLNRFSYTYNNPIKYIDPTGHCPAPPPDLGSGNIICFAAFIPTVTSSALPAGLYQFLADNRWFSSDSPIDRSRMWAWIDAETGKSWYRNADGEIVEGVYMHPTCTLDGECVE